MLNAEPSHLVLISDARAWRGRKSVLFLGEWCLNYIHRREYEDLVYKVFPYHWDDRSRLERDYSYLSQLYEELLVPLASVLNQIHGVRHSLRYWRVLIGPCLAYLLHMVYDRWLSIDRVISSANIRSTSYVDYGECSPPHDMSQFVDRATNDPWNQHIFIRILLTRVPNIDVTYVKGTHVQQNAESLARRVSSLTSMRRKIWGVVNRFLALFARNSRIFIQEPYLDKLSLFRLFLKLGQVPVIWKSRPSKMDGNVTSAPRKWKVPFIPRNAFEDFIIALLPEQLPIAFVEGYKSRVDDLSNLGWPCSPKVIYTAHSLWHDTTAMLYTAECLERGARLVYGQHGGVYGTAKYNFALDHELKISDLYLSWGKLDQKAHSLEVGITNLPTPSMRGRSISKGPLTFVTMNVFRYPYRLSSEAAFSYIPHHVRSLQFYEYLNSDVRKSTVVRLTRERMVGTYRGAGWTGLLML